MRPRRASHDASGVYDTCALRSKANGGRGGDNCKPQEIEGIFTYLSLIVVDPAGENT